MCALTFFKNWTIKLFLANTGIILKDMESSSHHTQPETAEFDALSHILLLFSLVFSNNRIYPAFHLLPNHDWPSQVSYVPVDINDIHFLLMYLSILRQKSVDVQWLIFTAWFQ